MPGGGYFTRLFSVAVGPKGKVYAFVPTEVASFEKGGLPANGSSPDPKHPNVTYLVAPVADFATPTPRGHGVDQPELSRPARPVHGASRHDEVRQGGLQGAEARRRRLSSSTTPPHPGRAYRPPTPCTGSTRRWLRQEVTAAGLRLRRRERCAAQSGRSPDRQRVRSEPSAATPINSSISSASHHNVMTSIAFIGLGAMGVRHGGQPRQVRRPGRGVRHLGRQPWSGPRRRLRNCRLRPPTRCARPKR